MAKAFVKSGGRLIIKSSAAGSTLFDGCSTNVTYKATAQVTDSQCQGEIVPEKHISSVSHEITGAFVLLLSDTAGGLGVITQNCYAVYLNQNGTTLFAGSVISSSMGDNQGNQGSAESMDISLVSDGTPDTGWLAA
jgi:hypothetical protein